MQVMHGERGVSRMVLVCLAPLAVAAVGCGELPNDETDESAHSLLKTVNGLTVINGLATTNGLMTTADGRNTVAYLVRCALPAGTTLVKKDQYGVSYSF